MPRRIYGEISHYRAPYKNSVLSGLGDATKSGQLFSYGPPSEKGVAAANQATLLTVKEAAPSSVGPEGAKMLRLNDSMRDAILGLTAKLRGEALANDAGIIIFPKIDAAGTFEVGSGEASMAALLGQWVGVSGRAPGASSELAPFRVGDKLVAYFRWQSTGDFAIPMFILYREPLDSNKCGEDSKKMGLPGCDLFEFFMPGDKWPAEVVNVLPKKGGLKAASILGYGALGVAAAAAAIVGLSYVSKKRTAKANRARRRRH